MGGQIPHQTHYGPLLMVYCPVIHNLEQSSVTIFIVNFNIPPQNYNSIAVIQQNLRNKCASTYRLQSSDCNPDFSGAAGMMGQMNLVHLWRVNDTWFTLSQFMTYWVYNGTLLFTNRTRRVFSFWVRQTWYFWFT